MTYKKRSLRFQFTLKEGVFEEPGNNVLTIENIKAEVEIGAYGGISGTTLEARVFGLSLENMALLSYKGIQLNGAKQNLVKVWADDRPIFYGSITNCFANLNQMPEAPLIISAFSTGYDQSVTSSPFSKEGVASVAEIITTIAASIGYNVVNNGVLTKLENPYFEGNPISQIQQCAHAAGIEIDFRLGTIYIWPQGGSVDDQIPLISTSTGLLGYPVPSNYGANFQCTYSDLILRGRKIQLETSMPNMSGIYTVQSAIHHLSTWTEGGPWSTIVWASIGQLTVRQ
ncbi:baseplate hub protein [Enterobacter asburiae]|uniref:baseplate hub protein n=1 Tax=Enterobacter asburiae TaxID=61645 RepID=UPI00307635E3